MVGCLSALTGYKSGAFYVVSNAAGSVSPSYVAQELQAGKLVVVASDSSNAILNNHIVPDHCYAVIGYDASSTMPFELYNPWGVGGYTTYDNATVYGNTFICNGDSCSKTSSSGGLIRRRPKGCLKRTPVPGF